MARLSLSDHRHNLGLNIVHEFCWGMGFAFNDVSTILPLFLTLLGAPLSVVGSIAGVFAILMAAQRSGFRSAKVQGEEEFRLRKVFAKIVQI